MRIPQHTQQAVSLFLPLWATAVTAISLSNFSPSIDDLPSACNTVYTQTIPGCQVSDFLTGAQCSNACINGLVQISAEVNSQCANADVPETSIIGVFLLGQGIPALCNNIQGTTVPATTQVKSTAASSLSAAQKSSAGFTMDSSSSPIMSSTLVTPAVASSTPPAVSSAGAKAGIGVGIAVAVLLIASGIILYIRRLKKALKAAKRGPPSTNETGIGRAELSADERARVPQEPPAEMYVEPKVMYELSNEEVRPKMAREELR